MFEVELYSHALCKKKNCVAGESEAPQHHL